MTNLEALSILGDLPMFSLLNGVGDVRPASVWAKSEVEEEGYEVREERRNYGRTAYSAVGLVGGFTVYREAR